LVATHVVIAADGELPAKPCKTEGDLLQLRVAAPAVDAVGRPDGACRRRDHRTDARTNSGSG
jgi:hypothetical protein